MKGEILVKVLELLHDTAMTQVDFFSAVLESGYGASSGKIEYNYQKTQQLRSSRESKADELKSKKLRLQKFLSKLKHDGLIMQTKKEKNRFFLSKKGEVKLAQLKNSLPRKKYQILPQHNQVIISFDIPEKMRAKRSWFREIIHNLGFRMIHQSTWVGKSKIPEELITDLEKVNLLKYVEIFEVSKMGTLEDIKNTK